MTTGKVGGDLSLDDGREAARLVALNLLATLRREARLIGPGGARGEGPRDGELRGGFR